MEKAGTGFGKRITKMEKEYLEKIREFYQTTAGELMNEDLPSIGANEPIKKAINEMSSRCLDHLWVVDGKKLVGVITEKDLLNATKKPGYGDEIAWNALEKRSLIFRSNRSAEDMMTKRLFTCKKDANVASMVKLMTDNRIRHLPVVEGDGIVGEITVDLIVKLVDKEFFA